MSWVYTFSSLSFITLLPEPVESSFSSSSAMGSSAVSAADAADD